MYKIGPFVKWVGGKGQILHEIISRLPDEYNHYYEPFVGSGAVLFGIQPERARINDINTQLINIYAQLKISSEKVINAVKKLDSVECNKDYYYENRGIYNEKIQNGILDAETAGLFIWINKHCFNGLYRVNGQGLFNVPYNNRTSGSSMVEENLKDIGLYLQNVEICNVDFAEFCNSVKKDDFVYFDSPYIPESETADFTSYTKGGFGIEEHKRLAALYKTLDQKGAKLMLSNNHTALVYELYAGYKIDSFAVKRMINRNAGKRTGREVIVTNYE